MLLLIATLVAGCTVMRGRSIEQASLTASDAAVVAADLTGMLQKRYGPGQTTFQLDAQGVLGASLETALRASGYAIADQDQQGMPLSYIVDHVSEQEILVRVTAGPDFQFNRLYAFSGQGVEALTGFTVREAIE
jgi:hypothetical protein